METPVSLPRSTSNLWLVSILFREAKRKATMLSAAKKTPIRVRMTAYCSMMTT